jgi:DNA-binding CsgD family transcriptional regulator
MGPDRRREIKLKLLERERELTEVGALLRRTTAGHGGMVVVEAHAGLGKSALLDAAIASAHASAPLRATTFVCDQLERRLAWAAAAGLLGEALADLTAPARRRILRGAAAPAGLLLDPGHVPGSAHADGDALIRALFLVIARLAERAPRVLALDDAHWCDEPSLRFLLYLQRRLTRLPVAILVASRPPIDAEGAALHDHLVSCAGATVLRPAPLGAAATATLVRTGGFDDAGDEFCHACWTATAGNPLYLHELLAELRRADAPSVPGQIAPASVARSVRARLREIPAEGAPECARAAAVLGDGAALRHVAALAGLDSSRTASVADALAAQQLLAPGEPIRFFHPLVRSSLYEAIPAAERAEMHARAAELLDADGAAPELVAAHLLQAPRAARPPTVARLRAAAARSVARGGSREAATYLRRAVEEPPPPHERAPVLVALARAEAAAGDPACAGHLREALAVTADERGRAEILLELGWAEHHAGRFATAADSFEQGLVTAHDDELRANLEAGYLLSAFFDTARSAGAQARIATIAQRTPQSHSPAQRGLLAQVLFARTMLAHPHQEVLALAHHLWDDGRLLAQEGPDSQTLWHVVGTLSWADDYATSAAATAAALREAEARGSALAVARGHYARAWPRYWAGELEGAAQDSAFAIEIWDGGLETYLPAAVYWRVLALLELGRHDEAERALGVAAPLERWEGTAFVGFLHAARAELAAADGRWEAALDDHLACGRVAEALHFRNPSIMAWRSRAAIAAGNMGDRDTAASLAAEELALAEAFGAPRALGAALRTCGLVGQAADALDLLERSTQVLESSGAALEHARSLVEFGAALRRANQRAAARRQLTHGHRLAQDTGAAVLAQRAATELRAAGGRTRRREPLDDELTASERRVAELAAAGHSNPEIARMLHVSVKAIEWHLGQTYRKLNIKSRHQLPSVLIRH